MGGIEKCEDIDAWKEARGLAQEMYRITRSPAFHGDESLRSQIQRAAVSIMANIAEGFDSGSDREFVKFLRYSMRSASELQSHLYVALDQGYVLDGTFSSVYARTATVKSLIGGFARYLRSNRVQRD